MSPLREKVLGLIKEKRGASGVNLAETVMKAGDKFPYSAICGVMAAHILRTYTPEELTDLIATMEGMFELNDKGRSN